MIGSLDQAKVLVCIGSGGVGKTSVAAALAVLAAEQGRKVLVLTIDPSLRLASALGIDQSADITKVPNQNFKGELYAGVIQHKKTFDEFVMRAAKKSESAQKILNNHLYQQLSTNLSGSQEFTALEKLYSCYEKNEFDLIVLDTPPAQHAIEFLRAPQKLASLFNEGITKWFRDPSGGKVGIISNILQASTKQVLKLLETLTGSQFIRELSDFFQNIEKWQGELEQRTIDGHRLLVNPNTKFVLVTAFDEAKMQEAELIAKEIKKGGYNLVGLVLNRSLPNFTSDNLPPQLLAKFSQFAEYNQERNQNLSNLEKRISGVWIQKVPEVLSDISDFKGLIQFSKILRKGMS